MTAAWALPRLIVDSPLDMVFRVFVVHRLSNALHELLSRWFGRMPWVLVLNQPQGIPKTLEPGAHAQAASDTPDQASSDQEPS
jgi:hypothetical protein